MEIDISTLDSVKVVRLNGDLDGSSSQAAQEELMPLAQSERRILLDLSGVPYMSSAGLRLLLTLYRQVFNSDGRVVLVGLSDDIKDTMEITGFLGFFTVCDTLEEGLKAVQS